MKFSELPISTIQEIKDLDAYMICNTVDHDNESVSNISKSLVHISNFAQKDEVNALVEQNAKLVEIVTTLVNKSNILEAELDKLKNQPAKAFGEGMEEINNQLEELKHRLDENLVEC